MEIEIGENIRKLHCPLTSLIAGTTSSGKTTLLFDILRHSHDIFTVPPKKIIYSYNVWQNLFEDMKKDLSQIEFVQGVPNKDDLDMWNVEQPSHKVLILDDLLEKAAKNIDIVDLFCQYSRHFNFSVFFVVQNLFANGKHFKTISLNTQYFFLLKQNRDQSQLLALAKQAFPGQVRYVLDAYRKSTEERPYGYLLLDLHPKTFRFKLRSNIMPNQLMSVFLPENSEAK